MLECLGIVVERLCDWAHIWPPVSWPPVGWLTIASCDSCMQKKENVLWFMFAEKRKYTRDSYDNTNSLKLFGFFLPQEDVAEQCCKLLQYNIWMSDWQTIVCSWCIWTRIILESHFLYYYHYYLKNEIMWVLAPSCMSFILLTGEYTVILLVCIKTRLFYFFLGCNLYIYMDICGDTCICT